MSEPDPTTNTRPYLLLGGCAVVFSFLYFLSDVWEAVQGGFSPAQLWLTLVAEAAIPVLVIGLYLAQRPRIARHASVAAGLYAYAYVFFTATVVLALVDGTPDYATLSEQLGVWMTLHGALMVVAGIWFGYAVVRAGVLPRWTGVALAVGVVVVAGTQGLAEGVQLAAAGIRDVGIAGMGTGLLAGRPADLAGTQARRP
jgi:hypothetical protein